MVYSEHSLPEETHAPGRRILERLVALNAVAAEAGACTRQEELFRMVGRRLHALGLESIVMLLTPAGQALRMTYVIAEDYWPDSLARMEQLLGRRWFEVEFDCHGACPLTAVVKDGQTRLVASMLDDMEVLMPQVMASYRWAIAELFPAWRAIYAPLRAGQRIIGVLAVFSNDLDEEDRIVIGAVANLLSAILEGVHRLEAEQRRSEQMELLAYLSQEISAAPPTLPALLRTVEEGVAEALRYDRARVGLLEGSELVFGLGAEAVRIPLHALHILAKTARLAKPQRGNASARRRSPAWGPPIAPQTRSLLAVPLVGGVERDQVAGVLYVESDAPDAFDQHDQVMLEAVANQLVVALHNVRLYEHIDLELTRRLRELATLLEIGRAVTSSLDFRQVLDRILTLAADAFQAERGWLGVIDEAAGVVRLTHTVGKHVEPLRGACPALAGSMTEWMIHNQPIVCIPDASVEDWYTPIFAKWVPEARPRNALVWLLIRRGRPYGIMALFDKRRGTFDPADVELIQSISLWATLALENAQLYQEALDNRAKLERSMARLAAALTSSYELKSALDTVLGLAIDLVGADAGSVELIVEGQDWLETYATCNLASTDAGLRFPLQGSLDGRALASGRPVVLEDALAHPSLLYREQAEREQIRSAVFMPLHGAAEALGALVVFRRQVRPFHPDEVALLTTFAQQAAGAIERAHLAERTRRQAEQLRAILESTREAVVIIAAGGEIEYANPAAQRGFKALPTGVRRLHDFRRYLPGESEEAYVRQMWARFLATGSFSFEVDVNDDAGQRRRYRVQPAVLDAGERYLIVASDITEAYVLERRRHEFLRTLHHELRGPLTNVLAYLEMMLSQDALSPEQRSQGLRIVYQQARRLGELLDELQTYALLDGPATRKPDQACDLNQIVALALEDVRRLYPGILFYNRLRRRLPTVVGERGNLLRAIRHLLDNAAKFSRQGGKVEVSGVVEGDFVRLTVRDEGVGFAPERAEEVFVPFHQLDDRVERRYPGVGLGLSLVRRVVESAGGSIEVRSAPGAGSTFTLRLPIGPPARRAPVNSE